MPRPYGATKSYLHFEFQLLFLEGEELVRATSEGSDPHS
jgi:hypothetical protein